MNQPIEPSADAARAASGFGIVAIAELAIVAGLVVGANIYEVVPISETPWLILLGWLSLRLRGLGWRSVGLRHPASWRATFALALIAGIGLQLLSSFVFEPVIEAVTGERQDLSVFETLVGDLPTCLNLLVQMWILAAIGEELSYRGYVLNRIAGLGRSTPAAYAVALILVSVLFGLGHWYQGLSGVCNTTFSGLYFGGLYLASGRNLWLAILAHGFSNTIALAMIYLGWVSF